MYTGMLHTHTTVVLLFVVLYLIKTVLLFVNVTKLEAFAKKTRVPEMIISTLFLLTGLYLALNTPSVSAGSWFWVKLAAVFASIPLAVIGFKRKRKPLALLSLLLLFYAYGISETKSPRMKKADFYEALAGADKQSTEGFDPMSDSYDPLAHGAALYANNCAVCHGADGALGAAGAKNLQGSMLDKNEMAAMILKGKNGMPGFKGALNDEEVFAVVAYVKAKISSTNPH
ncbi:MAG: hypothetical protein C0424_10660 [Sphingobacteriaceae bacterium]|nr:hypothetical protein [Sphingobacteriaceae bacterium]